MADHLEGDPEPWPLPSPEQIAAMVALLPALEAEGASFGRRGRSQQAGEGGPIMIPMTVPSELAVRFERVACDNVFVVDYSWMEWKASSEFFETDKPDVSRVDVKTIQRLLTGLIRGERFCDGALTSAFRSGLITGLVRRLKVLSESDG